MTGHLYCDEININTLTELRGNIDIFCHSKYFCSVHCCSFVLQTEDIIKTNFHAIIWCSGGVMVQQCANFSYLPSSINMHKW